jgi:hypothetical protein
MSRADALCTIGYTCPLQRWRDVLSVRIFCGGVLLKGLAWLRRLSLADIALGNASDPVEDRARDLDAHVESLLEHELPGSFVVSTTGVGYCGRGATALVATGASGDNQRKKERCT